MKISFKLFLLVSVLGFAQNRECGMQSYMDKYLKDSKNRAIHYDLQEKFQKRLLKNITEKAELSKLADPIKIPVAVHFPMLTSATEQDKKCILDLVQSQLDILNADYNATNKDISKWNENTSLYPNIFSGKMNVQFILATKNHPKVTGLIDGMPAITFGTNFLGGTDSDLTWKGYMNFVIRDLGSDELGHSPLGGKPSQGHTVVINTYCFGSGAGCPGYKPATRFNLGRTLTHELGHFFNLKHTFANNDGCGDDDDGIADTPKIAISSSGCPKVGSIPGCVPNQKALTMNYMDYVDDACMYMFTEGQALVMKSYYDVISSQFVKNVFDSVPVVVVDPQVKKDFSIHPVPLDDILNVRFEKAPSSCAIQIIDRVGRMVYEVNDTQVEIEEKYDMSFLTTGVYFVVLKFDNQEVIKKIMKR
ncbi:M43 family zinc metalloprotease [Flavobacterium oreochromis]|uniref:M43 family zinc metalloprotease n=1 Tax=Flavobacterium oreochromis TaxID=2906078 RepID=UPI00385ACC8D